MDHLLPIGVPLHREQCVLVKQYHNSFSRRPAVKWKLLKFQSHLHSTPPADLCVFEQYSGSQPVKLFLDYDLRQEQCPDPEAAYQTLQQTVLQPVTAHLQQQQIPVDIDSVAIVCNHRHSPKAGHLPVGVFLLTPICLSASHSPNTALRSSVLSSSLPSIMPACCKSCSTTVASYRLARVLATSSVMMCAVQGLLPRLLANCESARCGSHPLPGQPSSAAICRGQERVPALPRCQQTAVHHRLTQAGGSRQVGWPQPAALAQPLALLGSLGHTCGSLHPSLGAACAHIQPGRCTGSAQAEGGDGVAAIPTCSLPGHV